MNKVKFVTTTSTFSNKGREILAQNGINSEVKKVQGGTAAGCLFGISVSKADSERAFQLLKEGNIRIIAVE